MHYMDIARAPAAPCRYPNHVRSNTVFTGKTTRPNISVDKSGPANPSGCVSKAKTQGGGAAMGGRAPVCS